MNNSLTNRQIAFIIYCTIVGFGIINLPRDVVDVGETGGWVSLVILTLVSIAITYIITYVSYVSEEKGLYEYCEMLIGKFFAYILIIVYAVYFFLFFTMITRIYSETVRITILPKTPPWSIALFFFIVVNYSLKKGLNVIARVCEIYGIINIIGNIFMGVILFTQGKSINLRPAFVKEDILTYIVGAPKLVFIFLGVEMILFIPFNKKNNKNAFKYTTIIVGIIGLLYILISEAVISVVGVETVMLYKASLFNVVRGVDVQYLEIFRRLDGIYIIIWTFNIFCSVSLWGYGVITCINKVFKNSQGGNRVIYITLLAFTVSQIPTSTNDVENLLQYNGYLGYITTFVIPIILLIITKVKKYDKKVL